MKKVVLQLDLQDEEKQKQKAFKAVAGLHGIDEMAVDMKQQKMTIVGTVDPADAVTKLPKLFPSTDIISVGHVRGNKQQQQQQQQQQQEEERLYLPPVYPSYVGHAAKDNPNANLICWSNTRHTNTIT